MSSPGPAAEGFDLLAQLELPTEDRVLSPRTGWTRAHWERVADVLLDATRPYASRTQALIHLPGRPSAFGIESDGLEGFARTFLLASFRLRGASGDVAGLAERYAAGLVAGTRGRGTDAWPEHEDNGQSLVEAAVESLSPFMRRDHGSGSSSRRRRVRAWLCGSPACRASRYGRPTGSYSRWPSTRSSRSWAARTGRTRSIATSIWQTQCTGAMVGTPTAIADHSTITPAGDSISTRSTGRAWWATSTTRAAPTSIDERARRFLVDYRHFFAANGAPLHHGRSLNYRFGVLAPIWAAALAGSTPLAPGETRRLASGTLRYFLERGALRSGLLTRGWHGEFLPAVKNYSGPASPYWASKGFLGLILPADDPVWTAPEEPLAVERADFQHPVPAAGFLLSGTQADGIVRASTGLSDHFPFATEPFDDAHYRKLAYSTHTAPGTGHSDAPDLDAQFALEGDGAPETRRRSFIARRVDAQIAVSVTYPLSGGRLLPAPYRVAVERRLPTLLERRLPLLDIALWQPLMHLTRLNWGATLERIESASIPHGFGAIGIHRVRTPLARLARAGGFAIAGPNKPTTDTGRTWASATNANGLTSLIAGLHGFNRAEVHMCSDANAFGRHAAVPIIRATRPVDGSATYVTMTLLTTVAPPEALPNLIPTTSVEDDRITLTFPTAIVTVDLPRPGHPEWEVRTETAASDDQHQAR